MSEPEIVIDGIQNLDPRKFAEVAEAMKRGQFISVFNYSDEDSARMDELKEELAALDRKFREVAQPILDEMAEISARTPTKQYIHVGN
jgi:hypothetical protein